MLINRMLKRMIWFYLLVCLLTALLNIVFFSYQTLHREVNKGFYMTRQLLETYESQKHSSVIADLIFTIAREDVLSTFIMVVDTDGQLIFQRGVPQPVNLKEIADYMKTNDHYPAWQNIFWNIIFNKRYVTADSIVLENGKKIIAIGDTSYAEIHDALMLQIFELILLMLPAFLFIIFSSGKLLRKISRIVDNTTRQAKAIADGDYSIRLSYDQPSELSSIADSFNTMAEKVQETTAALSAFSGNIAHEIRNPLTGIKLASEMIALRSNAGAEAKKLAERITSETLRVEKLVQALLSLAKLDEIKFKEQLTFSDTNLDKIISEIIDGYATEIEEKNLQISKCTSGEKLYSDAVLLRQLLENILSNAIKFSARNGKVAIDCTNQDGTTIITISDSGAGIPADELPHIFERFYRSGSLQAVPGNGLGLAIVKKIADLLNGEITVSSTPGIGTTFRFAFLNAMVNHNNV